MNKNLSLSYKKESRVKCMSFRFIVMLFVLTPLVVFADNTEKLNMIAGQTELLRNITVDRISIGDPNVVEVEVLGETQEILVQALAPGFTDLRFWKDGVAKRFLVEVGNVAIGENLKQVRSALVGVEGIQVRGVGNNVLIEGNVYRQQDFDRIAAIAKGFPNVLPLAVKSNIDMQNIISMDVKFVEIRKNVLHNIGINWADAIKGFSYGTLRDVVTNDLFRLDGAPGDGAFTSGGGTTLPLDYGRRTYNFLGLSTRVDSVIDMLSSNGYARVLSEPKLSCISGGAADFLAGGEVPIPIDTDDGIQVTFKQYGIILNIEPVADNVGNISTKIEVEVSSIDPAVTVGGIPGFLTRKTNTEMNVRDGETIILSGMVSNESSKDVDKVPGLGHIPILGELFKSRQFRNNQTELYIFVTPRLITPAHQVNTDALKRVEEINEQHDTNYKYNIMD